MTQIISECIGKTKQNKTKFPLDSGKRCPLKRRNCYNQIFLLQIFILLPPRYSSEKGSLSWRLPKTPYLIFFSVLIQGPAFVADSPEITKFCKICLSSLKSGEIYMYQWKWVYPRAFTPIISPTPQNKQINKQTNKQTNKITPYPLPPPKKKNTYESERECAVILVLLISHFQGSTFELVFKNDQAHWSIP